MAKDEPAALSSVIEYWQAKWERADAMLKAASASRIGG